MRPLLNTLWYLVLTFPGGALLAPLAWVSVHGDNAPLSFLNEHDDFHRFVTRCIMIVALIGLWPLLKMNNMASLKAIGLKRSPSAWRQLVLGLSVGLGSFALLALIGVSVSPLEWNLGHPLAGWMRHFKNAGLAMIMVSVIEEFLFRGVLFGAMRRSLNWRWAAVFTSIIFAAVHFLNQKPPNPEPMSPLVGLITLPNMIHGPAGDPQWTARFVNLFLAGLVLAGIYQNTGSLFAPMAVHGGWIMGSKTVGMATTMLPVNHFKTASLQTALWGKSELVEGWAMTSVLLTIAVWVFVYQRGDDDCVSPNHDNTFIT